MARVMFHRPQKVPTKSNARYISAYDLRECSHRKFPCNCLAVHSTSIIEVSIANSHFHSFSYCARVLCAEVSRYYHKIRSRVDSASIKNHSPKITQINYQLSRIITNILIHYFYCHYQLYSFVCIYSFENFIRNMGVIILECIVLWRSIHFLHIQRNVKNLS